MKAVIPAAGLGSRMLPATKAVPKPMLPVVDRPTIQYVVEEALGAGAEEAILVVGPGDEAILDHLEATDPVDGELELSDAMARMTRSGDELYGVRFEGERYDIGTPAGFVEANAALALRRDDLAEPVREPGD